MNPDHIRKLIGLLAALLGCWWSWTVLVPAAEKIRKGGFEPFDILFLLTTILLMAAPGILAVIFGLRLFHEMKVSSLKWVIGTFAVVLALFLSPVIQKLAPLPLPDDLLRSASFIIASLIAVFVYLFVIRTLLRHLTCKDRSLRSFLSRGALFLIACQIWLFVFQIFEEYSPVKEGYTHVQEGPWGILGILVPIGVAYGLYRAFASLLPKAQGADDQLPARLESDAE